jgi:hypothetical protein
LADIRAQAVPLFSTATPLVLIAQAFVAMLSAALLAIWSVRPFAR